MESSSFCACPQGLKSIVNEKFGDGIMSAIDFYLTVDKVSAGNVGPVYELYDGESLNTQLLRESKHTKVPHGGLTTEAREQPKPSLMPSALAVDSCFSLSPKIKGSQGEDRVVITFNGKFLPFMEQTKEGVAFGVSEEG